MADLDFLAKPLVPEIGAGLKDPISTLGKFQEIQQRQIQMNALRDYSNAIDSGVAPEVAARHLLRVNPKAFGEVQEAVQQGRNLQNTNQFGKTGNLDTMRGSSPDQYATAAEGQTRHWNAHGEWITRKANEIINEKDPSRKIQLWNDAGIEGVKRGAIPASEWDKIKGASPEQIDQLADGFVRRGTEIGRYQQMTGQTAGKEAAARAPSQVEKVEPGVSLQTPATRPGGPLAGAQPSQPGTLIPPQPGSTAPIVPNRVTTVPATPGQTPAPNGAPPAGAPAGAGANAKDVPYYNEAPSYRAAPPMPSGPGIIEPGLHPAAAKANANALEKFDKDINPTVNAAAHTKASVGTMEAGLDSGRVSSDRLADIKMMAAGFINAMVGEKDGSTARGILGINLPWSEVFAKESTRMGLTFARQTEGAREAVQAIRIALAANPQMLNTVEGNKKILAILRESAIYDEERGKAASGYYSKQMDTTGTGHLEGFESWYNDKYAPAKFISRAVPYPYEPNKTKLQDGVTYEAAQKGNDGKPLRDKGGNIIYKNFVYRQSSHSMEPAEGATIQ